MSHLNFYTQPRPEGRKTDVIVVSAAVGNATLGVISFRGAWRKFVFAPEPETVFDVVCLREIADFCERKTADWRGR